MGMLATSGAEITSRAEDADIIVVNTCSFIDSAKQESVDTILEMARYKESGRAKKLIVAGCLVERYRDEIQKNIPQVDAVVGTGELDQILAAAQIEAQAEPHHHSDSPFKILNSSSASQSLKSGVALNPARVPKAMPASAPDDSRAPNGTAQPPSCPAISTTRTRRACWPRRSTRPTSRSPRAAIIPAPFASFRSCAASSARAASNRWWPRPSDWPRQGVREITLIGQDTTCYGEDLGLKDGLAAPARTARANRATALGAVPLRLSQQDHRPAAGHHRRATRRFALTSTCRCSTPRRRCCGA